MLVALFGFIASSIKTYVDQEGETAGKQLQVDLTAQLDKAGLPWRLIDEQDINKRPALPENSVLHNLAVVSWSASSVDQVTSSWESLQSRLISFLIGSESYEGWKWAPVPSSTSAPDFDAVSIVLLTWKAAIDNPGGSRRWARMVGTEPLTEILPGVTFETALSDWLQQAGEEQLLQTDPYTDTLVAILLRAVCYMQLILVATKSKLQVFAEIPPQTIWQDQVKIACVPLLSHWTESQSSAGGTSTTIALELGLGDLWEADLQDRYGDLSSTTGSRILGLLGINTVADPVRRWYAYDVRAHEQSVRIYGCNVGMDGLMDPKPLMTVS